MKKKKIKDEFPVEMACAYCKFSIYNNVWVEEWESKRGPAYCLKIYDPTIFINVDVMKKIGSDKYLLVAMDVRKARLNENFCGKKAKQFEKLTY